MIIFAIIIGIAALIAIIVGAFARIGLAIGLGIGGLLLGGLLGIFSSIYTQDVGDASVVVDWTGNIQGQETTPGLHFKSPFASVTTYSVRNNQVVFAGNGQQTFSGGSADGPDITVQDAQGVTSNIDVAVRYSIRPDQVTNVYKQYHDEQTFVSSFVLQDIRSVVRDAPNQFNTLDLITKRAEVNSSIQAALEARWKGTEVTVDSVSLQSITPPQSVTDAYASAQQAQIKVSTEQNNLSAAKVSAQQQVVQAEAKAKANDILNRSLSSSVIKQNYLDTLSKLAASGNVVVVPEGFGGIVNVK